MSLAKKWKDSPLVSLSAMIVAVATTAFAISQYFSAQHEKQLNEKHASEIESLKAEIASFRLALNDENTFDLESIVLKTGGSATVPPSSNFFRDDSFYAVTSSDHWSYREISENEYYRKANVDLNLPQKTQGAIDNVTVHTWTADEPIQIRTSDGTVRVQPTILVQRMDDQKLAMALGLNTDIPPSRFNDAKVQFRNAGFDQTAFKADRTSFASYEEKDERLKTVFDALRKDRTGKYFQLFSFLQFQASLLSPSTHYSLNRVQKRGDLLYAQSSTQFDNVAIDGRPVEKYYLHQEELFIADANQVYLVRMTIPSSEPIVEQNQRAELTRWLQQFRIVRN